MNHTKIQVTHQPLCQNLSFKEVPHGSWFLYFGHLHLKVDSSHAINMDLDNNVQLSSDLEVTPVSEVSISYKI